MQSVFFDQPLMPKLHYASEIKRQRGHTFYIPPHHHEDVTEFLLIREGEGHFHLNGQPFVATPHSLLFYQQGIWHEEQSNPETAFNALSMGGSRFQLRGLPSNFVLRHGLPPVLPLGDDYYRLEQRMRDMVREMNHYDAESQEAANHLFALFLLDLVRKLYRQKAGHKVNPSAVRAVAEVKRFIHEHYSEEISLSRLCRVGFTSANYMCSIFTKEVGLSPIQYLIHYRVETAKNYLRLTDEPIGTIAALVGYTSETHFMNLFKKITGMPPRAYRSMYREEG